MPGPIANRLESRAMRCPGDVSPGHCTKARLLFHPGLQTPEDGDVPSSPQPWSLAELSLGRLQKAGWPGSAGGGIPSNPCWKRAPRDRGGWQKALKGAGWVTGWKQPCPAAFGRRAQRKYISLFQTLRWEEFSDSWSSALASLVNRGLVVLRPKSTQPDVRLKAGWWHWRAAWQRHSRRLPPLSPSVSP